MEVWGFIDLDGNVLVEPQYYKVGPYRDGMARVTLTDMKTIGYIDLEGNLLFTLPPGTEEAGDFSEGLALVNTGGTRGEIDDIGVHGGRWGYIDKTGAWAIEPRFELTYEPSSMRDWHSLYLNYVHRYGRFKDGRAAVPVEGGWGFIDRAGKLVIPGPFSVVDSFHAGHARVRNEHTERLSSNTSQQVITLDAVINTDGEIVWETDWGWD